MSQESHQSVVDEVRPRADSGNPSGLGPHLQQEQMPATIVVAKVISAGTVLSVWCPGHGHHLHLLGL